MNSVIRALFKSNTFSSCVQMDPIMPVLFVSNIYLVSADGFCCACLICELYHFLVREDEFWYACLILVQNHFLVSKDKFCKHKLFVSNSPSCLV